MRISDWSSDVCSSDLCRIVASAPIVPTATTTTSSDHAACAASGNTSSTTTDHASTTATERKPSRSYSQPPPSVPMMLPTPNATSPNGIHDSGSPVTSLLFGARSLKTQNMPATQLPPLPSPNHTGLRLKSPTPRTG